MAPSSSTSRSVPAHLLQFLHLRIVGHRDGRKRSELRRDAIYQFAICCRRPEIAARLFEQRLRDVGNPSLRCAIASLRKRDLF